MYLNLNDYIRQIQLPQLAEITRNNTSVRLMIEMAALAEAKSYLVQKYDCSEEFTDMAEWSQLISYKALQRFFLKYATFSVTSTYAIGDKVTYLAACYVCKTAIGIAAPWDASKWDLLGNENDIYYGKLPAQQFDYYTTYAKDDVVFYKNKTYTAKKPSKEVLPDSTPFGFEYWGNGVAYSVAAGTLPTDTAYFVLGDNRSQKLVQVMIDISLYHIESGANPRNIPQLRIERYMGREEDRGVFKGFVQYPTYCALGWLQSAAGEADAITADLPKLMPLQGNRTRHGGYPKTINHY